MIVTPYKTAKVIPGVNLFTILDSSLPRLGERDIVVVTSKIVSICQGRIIHHDRVADKYRLIQKEADLYMENKGLWDTCGVVLTIKDSLLIPNAGIDESNGNGYMILWPNDVHTVATEIWNYLRKKHHLTKLGVLITDSHTVPLRWGTQGVGLSWCGFAALKNYIDSPDIFGRKLRVTKASILDGLAGAAVVTMGEGNEQTPLALIRDTAFVTFQTKPPTPRETKSLRINPTEDIYAPLINASPWQKGTT